MIGNRKHRLLALTVALVLFASIFAFGLYGIYLTDRTSSYQVEILGDSVKIAEVNQTPSEFLFHLDYVNITDPGNNYANGGTNFWEGFALVYSNATVSHNVTSALLNTSGFNLIHVYWSPNMLPSGNGIVVFNCEIQAPVSNYDGWMNFTVTFE